MSGTPNKLRSLGVALAALAAVVLCLPSPAMPLSRNGGMAVTASLIETDEVDVVDSRADRVVFVAPDGSRRLVGEGTEPAFSPDGQVVAAAQVVGDGNHGGPGIVLHRLDGTQSVRLTSGTDFHPTWSPTGRRIAFTRRTCTASGCRWGVYVIGSDGEGLRRIVRRGFDPAWSARGAIAYRASRGAIWVTNPRGTRHRRLVSRGFCCAAEDPEWSPSGDRIVFTRVWRSRATHRTRTSLFVGDRHGGHIRRVPGTEKHHAWVAQPSWSPDGRWIAFLGDTGSIQAIHPNGTSYKQLIRGGFWEDEWCPVGCPAPIFPSTDDPDWQPVPAPAGAF